MLQVGRKRIIAGGLNDDSRAVIDEAAVGTGEDYSVLVAGALKLHDK